MGLTSLVLNHIYHHYLKINIIFFYQLL